MKIAVLGGGAGGLSCCAELSAVGHSVNLFELPQFEVPHIDAIRKRGGIEVRGLVQGLTKLNLVTTEIEEAVKDVNVVLIVTPAYATETLCRLYAPRMEEGQIVIFHGKGGHTLGFVRILDELGIRRKTILGETHTLPWSARITGDGQLTIFTRNRILLSAALPAKDTPKAVGVLKSLYASNARHQYEIKPAENVLAVALCDANAMIHPAFVLFGLSRVDSKNKDFRIYLECRAAQSIRKIVRAMEKERLAVMEGFGLTRVSLEALQYPVEQLSGLEKEWSARFDEYVTVSSTSNRYITEDVPYGLVTIASLGDMVRVSTPLIDAVIDLCSTLNETDYRQEGRTVQKLGISGLDLRQVRQFVNEGVMATRRTRPRGY